MNRSPSFKIAFGGISLAITLLLMFGGSIFPGIDLTLFALASVFTAILIIETGIGGGLAFFMAAAALGLILIPNKIALIPYVAFFGYWGILKYFIEKIKKGTVQILCKCAFFALILSVGFVGFRELLFSAAKLPDLPVPVLLAAGVLFMLLYDYVFTFILRFYFSRFKGVGGDDLKLS